jgi:hypothetical protein
MRSTNSTGNKIYQANKLLQVWGRAIVDSEAKRLGLPPMSSCERPNHATGFPGNLEPTKEEHKIGKFMSEEMDDDEWLVASMVWGLRVCKNKAEMYRTLNENIGWSEGRVKRFEENTLQRVARQVV